MNNNPKTLTINGIEYVRADAYPPPAAVSSDGKPFVIIRSYGAGVFAGYLMERNDQTRFVILNECIRMHRWFGASLSQVAVEGLVDPSKCRFSIPVNGHEIAQVIEVIPCSEKAKTDIQAVDPWRV